MKYAIVDINGRQYFVKPDTTFVVDKVAEGQKKIESDKVLLLNDGKKIEVGKPYLKQILEFEILENIKMPKIRVATYKAKANYRRVIGQREIMSKIKLFENKKDVKK